MNWSLKYHFKFLYTSHNDFVDTILTMFKVVCGFIACEETYLYSSNNVSRFIAFKDLYLIFFKESFIKIIVFIFFSIAIDLYNGVLIIYVTYTTTYIFCKFWMRDYNFTKHRKTNVTVESVCLKNQNFYLHFFYKANLML